MKSSKIQQCLRITGVIMALLPVFAVQAYAQAEEEKKWLDDYPRHIGLTWDASASVVSNYIWRGLYVGGLSLQADASIGYGGLFANMWWNIGATDWTFKGFNPEVDIAVGFSRWGLQVYYIHMYYFDHYANGDRSRFFDMGNYVSGGGGTTGEWRVAYRVSNKLPLSVLVACRTFGRDGYMEAGRLKRAYSTYIELGYDFALPQDWLLATRVGMTPAKSLYTNYQGGFAINHIGLKLQKVWKVQNVGIQAFAHVMLNPWHVTAANLITPIAQAGEQKLNVAVGGQITMCN